MSIFTTSTFLDALSGGSGPAVRYPADLGLPPFEKWMLFRVKTGRHIGRTGMLAEHGDELDSTVKAVALYLPPEALASSMQVSWSEGSYGTAGGAMLAGALQTKAEATSPATTLGLDSALPYLKGVKGGLVSAIETGVRGGLTEIAQKGLGLLGADESVINVGKIVEGLTGTTTNPRTDIFFSGVSYRTHSFAFTLIPRSSQEAKAIDEILNIFQFYMLPTFGDEQEESSFIGYPYEFEIDMFTQHNGSAHHINSVDRSVLENISINHASGSRVSFVDEYGGVEYYPTSTSITLQFKEVRLQGRNRQTKIWRGENQTWNPEKYPDKRSKLSALEEGTNKVVATIKEAAKDAEAVAKAKAAELLEQAGNALTNIVGL